MNLTKADRKYLKALHAYRNQPMTVADVVWRARYQYVMVSLFFGLAAGVMYWNWGRAAAWMILISLITLLLRDFGHIRRSVSRFPVMREMIDWKKLEQVLFISESDGH